MNLAAALVLASFAVGALAKAPSAPRSATVERFCGKLQHVEYPRITATSYSVEARNLAHVVVNLYPAQESTECCEGAVPIATTLTGRSGSFNLKTKRFADGLYWWRSSRADGTTGYLFDTPRGIGGVGQNRNATTRIGP